MKAQREEPSTPLGLLPIRDVWTGREACAQIRFGRKRTMRQDTKRTFSGAAGVQALAVCDTHHCPLSANRSHGEWIALRSGSCRVRLLPTHSQEAIDVRASSPRPRAERYPH